MGSHVSYIELDERQLRLGEKSRKIGLGLAGAGAIVVVVAVLIGGIALGSDGWRQVMRAYLINYAFILSFAVGATFFVMIHHLTRAGWSTTVRRYAECIAMTFPMLALLAIPVVAASWAGVLYPWTHEVYEHSPTMEKLGFLNLPFFTVRMIVYFAFFSWLAYTLYRRSTRQDVTGDWKESSRLGSLSAPGMLAFGLVLTLFSMDLLMTLEPEWFSTIWGVYFFAGSMVGFFSVMILSILTLQRGGLMRDVVSREHFHDLGKLLFAFVVFWAYIAFSQFMLQWYANIPEETIFYQRRASSHLAGDANQWLVLSYVLMAGHFFIPLLGLISRSVKRRRALLAFWAVWMLIFHWIDLYWIVTPAMIYHPDAAARGDVVGTINQGIPFGQLPLDFALLAGMGMLFVGTVVLIARRAALVPVRDPRLQESLQFHQPF